MLNKLKYCLYCNTDDVEIIMLKDDVWEKINPSNKGWVCLDCMEEKLGRELTARDLDHVLYKDWAKRCNEKPKNKKDNIKVYIQKVNSYQWGL